MGHKLVLIFADGDEVPNIDKVLIFNNKLDAEAYLRSTGLVDIKIEPDDRLFNFNTSAWKGTGQAYWAKDNL